MTCKDTQIHLDCLRTSTLGRPGGAWRNSLIAHEMKLSPILLGTKEREKN